MISTFRLLTVTSILAAAACSSSGTGTPDASTNDSGGVDSGKKDTGTGNDAGTNDADNGDTSTGPVVDPACSTAVVTDGGSGGSCIVLDDDAGFSCNPMTNAPCKADAGESCDFDPNGGLSCFAPPPNNTAAICATCDDQNGPACAPGGTCVDTASGGACARFCCTNADCPVGHCDTTVLQSAPLGICVN